MRITIALFLFLTVYHTHFLAAQPNTSLLRSIDSLKQRIESPHLADTTRLKILLQLSQQLQGISAKQAESYLKEANAIALQLGDPALLASTLFTLSTNAELQGKYEQAIQYAFEALKIYTRMQDWRGMGNTYSNIGIIYFRQGELQKTKEYFEKSLEARQQEGNPESLARAFNNLGVIHEQLSELDKALYYYHRSLEIKKQIGKAVFTATTLGNIGNVYAKQGKLAEALRLHQEALDVFLAHHDLKNAQEAYGHIGSLLLDMGKLQQARIALEHAIVLADSLGDRGGKVEMLGRLKNFYLKEQDFRKALELAEQIQVLKDSLFSSERSRQIAEMQAIYDLEKKEQENTRLREQKQLEQERATRKNIIIIATSALSGLMVILLLVVYRNYRQKQQLNRQLTQQAQELKAANEQILQQNEELQQQQEEIMAQRDAIEAQNQMLALKNQTIEDSIRAARLIQQAILPSTQELHNIFSEVGLIYQPKDIVSGDFYWYRQTRHFHFLALADCTGHGAPGALMSMLGSALLESIILIEGVAEPAQILKRLNQELNDILRDEQGSYGMDMALLRLHEVDKHMYYECVFAGARRPLWYVDPSNHCVESIEGSRLPIGNTFNTEEGFQQHRLLLPSGSLLILFSDGIVDQNDASRSKFGKNMLKTLIQSSPEAPASIVAQRIKKALDTHMTGCQQRDDMTLLLGKLKPRD